MPVLPALATVRPRVTIDGDATRDPELLVDLVETKLANHTHGLILLHGPRGSGKTTALQHLAHHFGRRRDLLLIDRLNEELLPAALARRTDDALIVTSISILSFPPSPLEHWHLAPWSLDDRIEYLLARHPAHVASVIRRSTRLPPWCDLSGHPATWALVLDELARDESLASATDALQRVCAHRLARDSSSDLVERECERLATRGRSTGVLADLDVARATDLASFVHTPGVQNLIAARALIRRLTGSNWEESFDEPLPTFLLDACAALLPREANLQDRLLVLARAAEAPRAARALELLHRTASALARDAIHSEPRARKSLRPWNGARLAGIDLHSLALDRVSFEHADLSLANLSGAKVLRSNLSDGCWRGAQLTSARLLSVRAARIDLERARARGLRADDVNFGGASFRGADLTDSVFVRCSLRESDLTDASLASAYLGGCELLHAKLERTDLRRADLNTAVLGAVDLSSAELDHASFNTADLRESRWERICATDLDLRGANLARALMSGSRLRRARLSRACLRSCGLADVDWEGADLTEVDFTHASFHLGSTRAGLLVGAPAMWGSMTGYYTADAPDVERLPPETLRKANLRGCDLTGAIVEHCDFYLVDLRGARYTSEQAAHFAACRAILR